ncbi:MAG: N-acetylmuramoyl-L-alanine amidase [Candidatus Omnitrophota bacterium]|jgi:LysM repeat protein
MKRAIHLILLISLALISSSCATVPVKPPITPAKEIYPQTTMPVLRQDVFHIVAPGETLWRIAKMYNVPIKDISFANNLKTETLGKGQRLLVPKAAPIIPVIPLYPSKKWKYIIIHHSATDEGSSLYFDRYHLRRGWEGIGYHFVIDNGSKGKQDGQIEVSPRWLKQKNGAHCNADNMNKRSIGICLVGNFNTEFVSTKQLDALVYLTDKLRKYYKIPFNRIMGHGQVRGAKTECPGKKFPWKGFKSRLMAIE